MNYMATANLRESEPHASRDPLTPELAREGTETLAAATLFCRTLSFKVPDDAAGTSSAVLDASACLPDDWQPRLCGAPLTRALFDAASLGRVRFHHRLVSAFLAAQWVAARMAEGCPVPVLEEMQ